MAPPFAQVPAIVRMGVLLVAMLDRPAWSQESVEVRAALEAARADLRGQVLSMHVGGNRMMRHLVVEDPADDRLKRLIERTEPIGGPRWVDRGVVQVRMTLPALLVLDQVVAENGEGRSSRINDAELARLRREWLGRTLHSTGQAIPAARLAETVRAIPQSVGTGLSPDARLDAVLRARAHATDRIITQTLDLRFGSDQTIADALPAGPQRVSLVRLVETLPATGIVIRDDRQVEVTVFVDKSGIAEEAKRAIAKDQSIASEVMHQIEEAIATLPSTVIGRARLATDRGNQEARVGWDFARWPTEPMVASAVAASTGDHLRTARAAEREAIESLRSLVLSLPADGGRTLQEVARQNSAVDQAISRAVRRARVYQVEYSPDGSAGVRVTLDANDLIDELTTAHRNLPISTGP